MAANLDTIKAALLANPARLDVRAAAVRVISKRDNCGPDLAKIRLAKLNNCQRINDLFRSVLPEEYEVECRKQRGAKIEIADRFPAVLGFPIHDFFLLEAIAGYDSSAMYSIPIQSLSFHACPGCFNFADMTIPYQLAFLSARSTHSDFGTGSDCDQEMQAKEDGYWAILAKKYRLPARLQPTGAIDMKIFEDLHRAQKSPLRFLPDVLRTIDYSTGSIFLDYNEEEVGDPQIAWSRRNVEWLREDYARALQIEKNIKELDRWLRAKPGPRISQSLRLYNKAKQLTNAKTKIRVRVPLADSEGAALIRIL